MSVGDGSTRSRTMRSAAVPVSLLTALALTITGCSGHRDERRRCVDNSDTVVDDSRCRSSSGGGYRYYYGGLGLGIGQKVSGGSYTSSSRGGFGGRSGGRSGG